MRKSREGLNWRERGPRCNEWEADQLGTAGVNASLEPRWGRAPASDMRLSPLSISRTVTTCLSYLFDGPVSEDPRPREPVDGSEIWGTGGLAR